MDTRHRKKTRTPPKKIDTENIGHKTQEEDTDPIKKIYTENIGHKTQKEDTNPAKTDRHRKHWTQDTERRHGPHQKR